MLMTNFAAGEISRTLFGRIDLPQYYSGAARIENFDVIPTGGIKRRCGMERLVEMDTEGRLIPFTVSRETGFLLYLTPEKITAYKLVSGELSGSPQDFTAPTGGRNSRPYYQSLAHIREVQYAQNFDTMVLCHEDYPPIEIKLVKEEDGNEVLQDGWLPMSFEKTVIAGEGVTEDDKYNSWALDETYYNNRWLLDDDHFPAAVSFFNGRLVFAATKKSRQRIFAGAVKEDGKPYNFATVKTFLTEKKEYIVVHGAVDRNNLKTVILDPGEKLRFSLPLEKYSADSPLYKPGTIIEDLRGDTLYLSNRADILTSNAPSAALADMVAEAEGRDKFEAANRKEIASFSLRDAQGKSRKQTHYINPGATKIQYEIETGGIVSSYMQTNTGASVPANITLTRSLPSDAVRQQKESPSWKNVYSDFIGDLIEKYVDPLATSSSAYENDNIDDVERSLQSYSEATMKYRLVDAQAGIDQWYYDYPWQIKALVEQRYSNNDTVFIPFYTRDIIADEYPTPDCGFTFEIASDMNDRIRWLAVNKGLIAGTETGEWVIPPDIHATNIQAMLNSRHGSDNIQGTAVGDATCFFQAGKKGLVEYYIPQQDSYFRANNMAMLAPQMLDESPAAEFDFVMSPYAKLLITRDDGTMAALLYERGTGTFAWSRITTGPEVNEGLDRWRRKKRVGRKGMIKSAAVLPCRDGNDDIFLIVARAGQSARGNYFLEKLRENRTDRNVYLDSWRPYSGSRGGYAEEAVVWDEAEQLCYAPGEAPAYPQGRLMYIGYPYTSVMRTMPVQAQGKKQRIVSLIFRFMDSYMPLVTSILKGVPRQTDVLANSAPMPYTGLYTQVFPGGLEDEVQAELYTDFPGPVTILSLDAELQGGQ